MIWMMMCVPEFCDDEVLATIVGSKKLLKGFTDLNFISIYMGTINMGVSRFKCI